MSAVFDTFLPSTGMRIIRSRFVVRARMTGGWMMGTSAM
jgi:hypothetical protein